MRANRRGLTRAAALLLLSTFAVSTDAAAQTGTAAGVGGLDILIYAADAAAVILFVIAIVMRRRLSATLTALTRMRGDIDRLRSQAEAAPSESLSWTRPGETPEASPGLAALIGATAGSGLSPETVVEALAADRQPAIRDALAALSASGTPFCEDVAAAGGRRIFRLDGRALGDAGAILWVSDVTDEATRLAAAERRADEAEALLDAAPMPFWRRDREFKIAYANAAYRNAVDAAPDAPVSELAELAAGVIPQEGRALARRAVEAGAPQSETHHIVMAGARRLTVLSEVPLPGDQAVAGLALDRTEAEELREELARYTEAHEDVLQNLGTAIAIYGADQRLQFFNSAFVQLWHLDESWLRGEPTMGEVLELLRERRRLPEQSDFPAFKREQQSLFTSLIDPVEELVHLPDGMTFRAVTTPHPFGGLLQTWEDVTDALALERSYNTLNAVQRETLDNLYEGVAVIGGDGRLKLTNPAFGKMWQLAEEELTDEPHVSRLVERMRDLVGPGTDWPENREDLMGLLTDREPQSGRLERLDGSVLDFATVPLPDGAVLLSFLDVSDSIRVERALRERNEALETADRLKSEFIANVSYELRTPLNTIIGFAEILNGQYFGALNERQIEYSQGVLESSQRLLSLINDILDLASIEAGHMALELETIDIHEMLEAVIGLVRERARKKKVEIVLDCPGDIGALVADERRLKQAFFNILSNSIKFTPEEGQITVSGRRAGGALTFAFSDTGIGMTDDERQRAFGRFERGANPDARRSGAGLGLSLVKSFIELHGGKVELESHQGSGTSVTCRLPARKPQAAA